MTLMTISERNMLSYMSFESLWNTVWYHSNTYHVSLDFNNAKELFEEVKRSGLLMSLLKETKSEYYDPGWGFPKGRRKLRERDLDCAIREFCEETGLSRYEIRLLPDKQPYEEVFYGTNGIQYRHVYYIAKIVKNIYKHMMIDYCNIHQVREVNQIKWFNSREVLKRIRDYNLERRELFIKVVEKIENHQPMYIN